MTTEHNDTMVFEQVGTKMGPSRDQVIKTLLKSGWVEMTVPDKPSSSKQKYQLTKKGQEILNKQL